MLTNCNVNCSAKQSLNRLIGHRVADQQAQSRDMHERTTMLKARTHFEVCPYCSTEDGKGVGWGRA